MLLPVGRARPASMGRGNQLPGDVVSDRTLGHAGLLGEVIEFPFLDWATVHNESPYWV